MFCVPPMRQHSRAHTINGMQDAWASTNMFGRSRRCADRQGLRGSRRWIASCQDHKIQKTTETKGPCPGLRSFCINALTVDADDAVQTDKAFEAVVAESRVARLRSTSRGRQWPMTWQPYHVIHILGCPSTQTAVEACLRHPHRLQAFVSRHHYSRQSRNMTWHDSSKQRRSKQRMKGHDENATGAHPNGLRHEQQVIKRDRVAAKWTIYYELCIIYYTIYYVLCIIYYTIYYVICII